MQDVSLVPEESEGMGSILRARFPRATTFELHNCEFSPPFMSVFSPMLHSLSLFACEVHLNGVLSFLGASGSLERIALRCSKPMNDSKITECDASMLMGSAKDQLRVLELSHLKVHRLHELVESCPHLSKLCLEEVILPGQGSKALRSGSVQHLLLSMALHDCVMLAGANMPALRRIEFSRLDVCKLRQVLQAEDTIEEVHRQAKELVRLTATVEVEVSQFLFGTVKWGGMVSDELAEFVEGLAHYSLAPLQVKLGARVRRLVVSTFVPTSVVRRLSDLFPHVEELIFSANTSTNGCHLQDGEGALVEAVHSFTRLKSLYVFASVSISDVLKACCAAQCSQMRRGELHVFPRPGGILGLPLDLLRIKDAWETEILPGLLRPAKVFIS